MFRRTGSTRGVTLIATVLLSALAATITLVIVRQTVLVTRTESVKTDYSRAYAAAVDVQGEFERRLRDNPRFYLTEVFAYERPRLCAQPPASPMAVYHSAATKKMSLDFPWALPPDDPRKPAAGLSAADAAANGVGSWPAQCGTSWTYLAPGKPLLGFSSQVLRAEIEPPSPDDPSLTLRVLAAVGSQETGIVSVYRPDSAAATTVYSGTDLRLDELYAKDVADTGAAPLEVAGSVYANGRVWLPSGDVNLGGAQLFAEDGFVGTPGNSQARLYTGRDTELSATQKAIFSLRSSVAQPLTMESLRASAGRVAEVACPKVTADPFNYPEGHPRDGTSSVLCLAEGGKAVDDSGSIWQAPAHVTAWLLMPTGSTVNVYYAAGTAATEGDDLEVAGTCRIACQLPALAAADLTAGTHPGGPLDTSSVWVSAGKFRLPASGVVGTDATTYVSHCVGFELTGPAAQHPLIAANSKPLKSGSSDLTGPQCAPEPDGGAPGGGIVVDKSLSILAGTPRNPADIVIAGPIRSTGAKTPGHLGLMATGTVRVPYFARPAGGDLPLAASLAAFGFGSGPDAAGLVSQPQQYPARTDAAVDANYGDTLELVGSVAAAKLDGIGGFRRVEVGADPTLKASPPPYFASFSDRYTRVSTTRLSSQALCGAESATRVNTCQGVW